MTSGVALERLALPVCSEGLKHMKAYTPYCLGSAYDPMLFKLSCDGCQFRFVLITTLMDEPSS